MRQNWEISAAKAPLATFIQPLDFAIYGYELHKTLKVSCTQPQHLDAAETELQSTIEFRTTATQIAALKPDLDAQAEKRRFWLCRPDHP